MELGRYGADGYGRCVAFLRGLCSSPSSLYDMGRRVVVSGYRVSIMWSDMGYQL